jgi:hypothetical protein
MSFVDAPKVPVDPPASSGISMSMQITKNSKKVRFTISEKAQEIFFGQSLRGKYGKVMIGSGDDEGLAQLILADGETDMPFTISARGSTFISVGHWLALPNDKRPAASCDVVNYEDGVVTIRMPTWSTPKGKGGKLCPPEAQAKPKAPTYKS